MRSGKKSKKSELEIKSPSRVVEPQPQPHEPLKAASASIIDAQPQAQAATKQAQRRDAIVAMLKAQGQEYTVREEGKYIAIIVGADPEAKIWIGPTAGAQLPFVRSYGKSDDQTMCSVAELLRRQRERAAKKTDATTAKPQDKKGAQEQRA